jgi:predicted nucleic acid-binding Zn ribbon protein
LTRGNAAPVGSVIEGLIAKWGIRKPLKRAEVITGWPDIVGKRIAKETKAERIRNTILFISCSSPMWAQELGLLKPTIIKKIRARVGPGIVTDIHFKTGQI